MAVQLRSLPLVPTEATPPHDMIFVPGGMFRMGFDNRYPEAALAHRITVDSFFIARAPVTNRAFHERFVGRFPILKCNSPS